MFEFLPDNPKEALVYASALAALGGFAVKATHVVERGEKGVVVRNGNPVKIVGTGLKFAFYPMWRIKSVNTKDRTNQLKDALFMHDNQFWKADVSVTWAVREDDDNPIKAHFNVEHGELDDTVKEICADGLDKAFKKYGENVVDDLGGLKETAMDICRDDLLYYGVAIKRYNIYNPTQRDSEVLRQAIRSVQIGEAVLREIGSQGDLRAG